VATLTFKGIPFAPGTLTTGRDGDQLTMLSQDGTGAAALPAQTGGKAQALLKDGRVLDVPVLVGAPRPSVRLIAKSIETQTSGMRTNIVLTDASELPQDARLVFSLRAVSPATFNRDEALEVATADESFSTTLSLGQGITLQNAAVAVATLEPARAFGFSAAGPLQFRVIAGGVSGDWQPLATLVRLPVLQDLQCPATPELACKLSGSNLFLIDSVAGDSQFAHAVPVPDGFPGSALPVPHPGAGGLYVKLRDDPAVIHATALGAQQLPVSSDEAARAPARHAAAHAGETAVSPEAAPAPLVPTPADTSAPSAAPAPSS